MISIVSVFEDALKGRSGGAGCGGESALLSAAVVGAINWGCGIVEFT